jgi:hypothetical protein
MKTVDKKTFLEDGIQEIIHQANNDYTARKYYNSEKFTEGWKTKRGKKYIKITNQGSAWGFVCLENDPKFNLKKGDLLFPASWSTPAKNFARGNVFRGGYQIEWTGPLYYIEQ